jgi:hypothetical protein
VNVAYESLQCLVGLWQNRRVKRGRRILLVVAACGVLVVVAALMWPREREPVYQGKKLSEWIQGEGAVMREYVPGVTERADAVRRDAVRHIGTNALPFLLKWIVAADVPERSKLQVLVARTSRRAGQVWDDIQSRKLRRAYDAGWAFDVLGYDARAALPDLIWLLRSTNRWVSYLAKLARGSVETAVVVAETNRANAVSSARN